jgi:hypothetical protein
LAAVFNRLLQGACQVALGVAGLVLNSKTSAGGKCGDECRRKLNFLL